MINDVGGKLDCLGKYQYTYFCEQCNDNAECKHLTSIAEGENKKSISSKALGIPRFVALRILRGSVNAVDFARFLRWKLKSKKTQ